MDGYIEFMIHHGSITQALFNEFVRTRVLPHCTPFELGGLRSVLAMDNAKQHKSPELIEMCNEAGMYIAWLPKYSPDFNPIETSFALLKRWIKRNGDIATLYEQHPRGFQLFLYRAVQSQRELVDPGALFRASHIPYPQRV